MLTLIKLQAIPSVFNKALEEPLVALATATKDVYLLLTIVLPSKLLGEVVIPGDASAGLTFDGPAFTIAGPPVVLVDPSVVSHDIEKVKLRSPSF